MLNKQNSPTPPTAKPGAEHLLAFAEVLNQQNDFSEILRMTAQQAAALLHADLALLFMINPRTRHTVRTLYAVSALPNPPHYHAIHQQLAGWVMANQQALCSANLAHDERFARMDGQEIALHSVLCVPLKVEGLVIGSLLLGRQSPEREFKAEDLAYLEQLALVAAPYLRNAHKIAEYFAAPLPEATLLAKYKSAGLIGKSVKFIELLKTIEAAARCEVRVLLEGETGTGKELVARAIHHFSARQAHPFVAMDCGAIPENLIESELFGHVKGAFTGASHERKGLFEEAGHGTLFMDEVANLPLSLQTKFMRVLEQSEIRPLGGNAARKIDVRLIAASSRPLRELVKQQLFREDLYYRLHVYPIALPALHERQEDIPLLAEHFLQSFARQQQKPVESFHEELIEYICVRELGRAMCDSSKILSSALSHSPRPRAKFSVPKFCRLISKPSFKTMRSHYNARRSPRRSWRASRRMKLSSFAKHWPRRIGINRKPRGNCACLCKRCNIACTSWGS